MFDFPIDKLDESPRLRMLVNNLLKAARMEYQNESSLTGAAMRDLVKAVRNPTDPMWGEMKVPASERQAYNQVANAAHNSLKG